MLIKNIKLEEDKYLCVGESLKITFNHELDDKTLVGIVLNDKYAPYLSTNALKVIKKNKNLQIYVLNISRDTIKITKNTSIIEIYTI